MCSHCPEALAPALQHQFILYASQLSCSGMFTPREQQQNPGCQEEMQRNTRLSNVILSCHSIREARNFNSVCCICCYGSTGASLTARRAACAHTYVTCGCIPDTRCRGHENHAGPKRQRTSSAATTHGTKLQDTRSARF